MIDISVNESGIYSANVLDLNGKIIAEMYIGLLDVGNHSIKWNGNNIQGKPSPSGIYFFLISNSKFIESKKLILLR
jgi:flagellar hook assembly protein FlgD